MSLVYPALHMELQGGVDLRAGTGKVEDGPGRSPFLTPERSPENPPKRRSLNRILVVHNVCCVLVSKMWSVALANQMPRKCSIG